MSGRRRDEWSDDTRHHESFKDELDEVSQRDRTKSEVKYRTFISRGVSFS